MRFLRKSADAQGIARPRADLRNYARSPVRDAIALLDLDLGWWVIRGTAALNLADVRHSDVDMLAEKASRPVARSEGPAEESTPVAV